MATCIFIMDCRSCNSNENVNVYSGIIMKCSTCDDRSEFPIDAYYPMTNEEAEKAYNRAVVKWNATCALARNMHLNAGAIINASR